MEGWVKPLSTTKCVKCNSGRYAFNSTFCAKYTSCHSDEFLSSAGNRTSDNVCSSLTPCRGSGFFISKPHTLTSDRECSPLTVCHNFLEFTASEATPTSDRVCQPLTVCLPGTFVSVKSSAKSDRQCLNCPAETFSRLNNSLKCKDWKVCSSNQYQSVVPTATINRGCSAISVCTLGETEISPPTSTSDRVCGFTTCLSSQVEISAPTASTDRVCGCPGCVLMFDESIGVIGDCSNADDLSSCSVVQSLRYVYNSTATSIINSMLTLIRSGFYFQENSQLTLIRIPALSAVLGDVYLDSNAALQSVEFPSLTFVLGSFQSYENSVLIILNIISLSFLFDRFAVVFCPQLTEVNLPQLSFLPVYFGILQSKTELISLPSLTWSASITVYVTEVTSLVMSSLQKVPGSVNFNTNLDLTQLSLPALRATAELIVTSNLKLTFLSIPLLTSLGRVSICRNGVGLVLPNPADLTAPAGGLVTTTGPLNNAVKCSLQASNTTCTLQSCP